jgi:hypothetical protein
MIGTIMLRQETSHLFLIPTNFGYGTVLTADCARQGCSAYYYYYYCHKDFHNLMLSGANIDTTSLTAPTLALGRQNV